MFLEVQHIQESPQAIVETFTRFPDASSWQAEAECGSVRHAVVVEAKLNQAPANRDVRIISITTNGVSLPDSELTVVNARLFNERWGMGFTGHIGLKCWRDLLEVSLFRIENIEGVRSLQILRTEWQGGKLERMDARVSMREPRPPS